MIEVRHPRLWACVLGVLAAVVATGVASAATATPPTYGRDVEPILRAHCVNCHGPSGMAAGMPLASYAAVYAQAQSIAAAVSARRMPPWPADPAQSAAFRNDPRLRQTDIDTLTAWVRAGAPPGDTAEPPASPEPQEWAYPGGRAPDAVITLPAYTIEADREIPYIQQLFKVPYATDKWVVAMQLRAGNRRILHHMGITEVALPAGMKPEDLKGLDAMAAKLGLAAGTLATVRPAVQDELNAGAYDMFGVYTPGTTLERYGDDSAKLLKSGADLYIDFNIHYTSTAQVETDRSALALWFADRPPAHQLFRAPAAVQTILANGHELLNDATGTKAEGTDAVIPPIPAHAGNYELVGVAAFSVPITIYQLQPHAHMRAKDFRYVVIYPDGRAETLLTVPHYDFHWQLAYELAEPRRLPAGSKLIVTAHYDNSDRNTHLLENEAEDPGHHCGPDKVAYFRRQNQSWDEMFSPFVQYAVDRASAARPAPAGSPPLVQAVGCLTRVSGGWVLAHAGEPLATEVQSSSSTDLVAAARQPPGNEDYRLLGVDVFHPARLQDRRVAVKGLKLEGDASARLNVTSLQALPGGCAAAPPAQAATDYRLTPWPKSAASPDFKLIDVDGKPRRLADYRGRIVIVFFGFLHCPDFCPTELLKLGRVMRELGPRAPRVQVLFVTLDPQRDTRSLLDSYVHHFDPRFIGLTGSAGAIDRAAASFHVQYARVTRGADYTIDHSTATFVLDGAGRLRLIGSAETSSADYAHDLDALLRE